jgi:hypothetical protein
LYVVEELSVWLTDELAAGSGAQRLFSAQGQETLARR